MLTILFISIFLFGVNLQFAYGEVDCKAPPPANLMNLDCCMDPELSGDDVLQKCNQHLPKGAAMPPAPPSIPTTPSQLPSQLTDLFCFAECVFNASKIPVAGNEKLTAEKIKPVLAELLKKDADFIPIWEKALLRCDGLVDTKVKGLLTQPAGGKPNQCAPRAMYMIGCLHYDSMVNCPASKWMDNPQCKMVKEYLKACSPFAK